MVKGRHVKTNDIMYDLSLPILFLLLALVVRIVVFLGYNN